MNLFSLLSKNVFISEVSGIEVFVGKEREEGLLIYLCDQSFSSVNIITILKEAVQFLDGLQCLANLFSARTEHHSYALE